jgi:hypothetical protein
MRWQQAQRLLDEIDEDDLTVWEIDFVESIATRVQAEQDLTDGQSEKLEQIHEKERG